MTARKKAYLENAKPELDEYIAKYTPLVKRLASQIASRLPPNVALDDLVQEGLMGLLDAAKRYEPRPGLNFEAYARFRITGAIYDSCRKADILPRNQRDKLSELEKTMRTLEQELGRPPSAQEIADACEISLDDYHQALDTMVGMTAIDDVAENLLPIAQDADPAAIASLKQVSSVLAEMIKELPEKERMVLALHYQEDLSFREVAYVLDLTPGRISQLHSQAMMRIRAHKEKLLSIR